MTKIFYSRQLTGLSIGFLATTTLRRQLFLVTLLPPLIYSAREPLLVGIQQKNSSHTLAGRLPRPEAVNQVLWRDETTCTVSHVLTPKKIMQVSLRCCLLLES